jgi:aspartyl-tRNA(Asn)/glutamyl-tRNA(Gln) amidotransferase subunit A
MLKSEIKNPKSETNSEIKSFGNSNLDIVSKFDIRNSNLSILDVYMKSRAEGFGAEAKRRIMLGSYVLSAGYYDAYYKKAQKVRTVIKEEFDEVFKKVDILATPVSPTPAFKFGEKAANPLSMYLSDIMTVPVNPAGVPAISIPAGFVERESKELPVGLQLIGPMWGEQTLLNVGHAYQQVTDWHRRKPALKN